MDSDSKVFRNKLSLRTYQFTIFLKITLLTNQLSLTSVVVVEVPNLESRTRAVGGEREERNVKQNDSNEGLV